MLDSPPGDIFYSAHSLKKIMNLLGRHSKFPISSYIIGGGLEAGENTSTCLKADVDVTVFVTWSLNDVRKVCACIKFPIKIIIRLKGGG